MLRLVSLLTMLLGAALALAGLTFFAAAVQGRAIDVTILTSLILLAGGALCVLGGAAGFALARIRDDVTEATRCFLYPAPPAIAPVAPPPPEPARRAAMAESAGMAEAIRAEQARALRETGEAINGVEALRRIQARG